jgi:hypothetical protein
MYCRQQSTLRRLNFGPKNGEPLIEPACRLSDAAEGPWLVAYLGCGRLRRKESGKRRPGLPVRRFFGKR